MAWNQSVKTEWEATEMFLEAMEKEMVESSVRDSETDKRIDGYFE